MGTRVTTAVIGNASAEPKNTFDVPELPIEESPVSTESLSGRKCLLLHSAPFCRSLDTIL